VTPQPATVRDTLRALAAPRRLVPILVVSASLVYAQAHYSPGRLAIPVAVLTCVAFVLVAPLAFRVLFPDDERTPHLAARVVAYVGLAAVVNVTFEILLPELLGLGWTFLSDRVTVGVSLALFVVGGWGLGRDIGFEASLARERARAAALAREAEAAQLLALRSHLDPHFLFNTLNAIAEWCREDGAMAEKAILTLSSMLREILGGVRAPSWPLSRELALVDALLSLHHVRDPQAFTVERDLGDAVADLPIVPLLLLPLAENAIKHGPAAGQRGVIHVRAHAKNGTLTVEIENPGAYAGPREGSDGLPLVRRRLVAAYGAEASLVIGAVDAAPSRTRVSIALPSAGPLPGVTV
jgi:signal transduction histidine kinase